MQDLKISLITASYNAEATIGRCIESVIAQNYRNLEYIIVDGGSADGTLAIINNYKPHINILLSEPDNGFYDAINKGIRLASGEVVGTLNADDLFADSDVLDTVANRFLTTQTAIVYGHLDYVSQNETILRRWRTKAYTFGMFNRGWMPPHPTFYCRKELFESLGYYSLEFGTAADYELMLRFMHLNNYAGEYIDKVMVKMQRGGMSNSSLGNRVRAWQNDLRSMRKNKILHPLLTLIIKPLRKITQYF